MNKNTRVFSTHTIILVATLVLPNISFALTAEEKLMIKKKSITCSWSNNLKLDENIGSRKLRLGYLGKDPKVNQTRYTKALSLKTTSCDKSKKVCYGQVTCDGIYKIIDVKGKNSRHLTFDFYTYASCLVDADEPCPSSAAKCLSQKGKIEDLPQLLKKSKGYGYFEDEKSKPKTKGFIFKNQDAIQ